MQIKNIETTLKQIAISIDNAIINNYLENKKATDENLKDAIILLKNLGFGGDENEKIYS